MITLEEIKKLDQNGLVKKIDESRKEIFDNKQKINKGEFKDVSFFKKQRKAIAQMTMQLAQLQKTQGNLITAKVAEVKAKHVPNAPKVKKAKVHKAPKVKAEKVAKAPKVKAVKTVKTKVKTKENK